MYPTPSTSRSRSSYGDESDNADTLMRELVSLPEGPRKAARREEVIAALLPVARRLARRYRGKSENLDDLEQVASLGLVKAVDRFDPARGHDFLSYAVPTIAGELRRHFRDNSWHVHVPRGAQETVRTVRAAQAVLQQSEHSAEGLWSKLRETTGLTEEEIRLALRADGAYGSQSLDTAHGPDDASLADRTGVEDLRFEHLINLLSLRSLVRKLPERQQRILYLYFYRCMTQQEVASAIGVSQMHVCRLLSRSCAFLREGLTAC